MAVLLCQEDDHTALHGKSTARRDVGAPDRTKSHLADDEHQ